MKCIDHRINTLSQLAALPRNHGAEIDIRTYGQHLVLNHAPCQDGDSLVQFLDAYRHQTLILNVKEDGLETQILDLLSQRAIHDFFFLDLSLPAAVKLARSGESRFAVRFSEFEPLEACLRFAGLAQWCWVDRFTTAPPDRAALALLKQHFKLCLVSPELQGREPTAEVRTIRNALETLDVDAVCTDLPELWS